MLRSIGTQRVNLGQTFRLLRTPSRSHAVNVSSTTIRLKRKHASRSQKSTHTDRPRTVAIPSYVENDPTASFSAAESESYGYDAVTSLSHESIQHGMSPGTDAWMTMEQRLNLAQESLPEQIDTKQTHAVPDGTQVVSIVTPKKASKEQKSGKSSSKSSKSPQTQSKKNVTEPENGAGNTKTRPASKSKPKTKNLNAKANIIRPRLIKNKPVEMENRTAVPRLAHKLDRVLFDPGPHVMQDPRTQVFNFDPDIAKIMPVEEFDFEALGEYITSSKDTKLRELCKKYEKKFCGSTSSLSAMLAHFHYLISHWRPLNFAHMSKGWEPDSYNFTQILRAPAATFAHHSDGVYAIDADKGLDTETVLSSLGKSMEKLLILPKEEYDKYRRTRSHEIPEEQKQAEETYHYSTLGDFLVRSQLDAYDPRLPGTGVFDIKTRAVVSIRMDVSGYEKGTGYEISRRFGRWDSFEREYVDLIRAAFLKYSLQVRMGRMDGIFAAYHNTQRIFGFEYIPLSAMDFALHGTEDPKIGDEEFKASITMLNQLLDKGTQRWPNQTLRLHVETRDTKVPMMYFFIEPVSEDEMQAIQNANKKKASKTAEEVVKNLKILQAESEVQDVEATDSDEGDSAAANTTEKAQESFVKDIAPDELWAELMERVEETLESEDLGTVRAEVAHALEDHGVFNGKSDDEVRLALDKLLNTLVDPATTGKERSSEAQTTEDSHEDLTSAAEAERDIIEADQASVDAAVERQDDGASAASGLSLKELILARAGFAEKTSGELKDFDRVLAEIAPDGKLGTPLEEGSQPQKTALGEGQRVEEAEHASADIKGKDQNSTTSQDDAESSPQPHDSKIYTRDNLLGMLVHVRNRVDGVEQPRPTGKFEKWDIEYLISELPEEMAAVRYAAIKKRRTTAFGVDSEVRARNWKTMFGGELVKASERGSKLREKLDARQAKSKFTKVAWVSHGLKKKREEEKEVKKEEEEEKPTAEQ